jgi:hypothetical protein
MPDTHDTRDAKPATRQPTPGEVLRARPVKGKVDYAELIREHMARYPRIREALAK